MLPILDRYRSRYLVIDNTDNTLHDFYLKVLKAASPQEFSKYRPAADPTRWPFLFATRCCFLMAIGAAKIRTRRNTFA